MKKLRSDACKTCPGGGESLNMLNPMFHRRVSAPRSSYSHVYKCEYEKEEEEKRAEKTAIL